ncbi:MAG: nucleotide exchange factor GrpE [Bacillota bacterium]
MKKKYMDASVDENVEKDETADSNVNAVKEEMEEQTELSNQEDLKEALQKKQEELDDLNSRLLRMTADFQNFRKRAEKERNDIYQFACEKLIVDLLPILDNLERAANSSKENTAEESISKGVQMVLQQFTDVLKKNGVEEIAAEGQAFDPNLHHAVMQEDHPEYESNSVIAVFQKGYSLNGKVIRPCMVKVAN